MAQPIPLHLAPREQQHELNMKLQQAPEKHAEAILSAYDVLQLMYDQGVLELMRGTLGGGEKIIEQVVAVASGPDAVRASRNLLLLVKALGEIEPSLLSDLTRAVPKALVQANTEETKTPGLFKLLNTFRNRDFRTGLAAFNNLLVVFGKNLAARGSHSADV